MIPVALSLVTVKVTGPAGTEFVSGVQASLPDWLASVTFTVLIPPSPALAAPAPPGLLLAASELVRRRSGRAPSAADHGRGASH